MINKILILATLLTASLNDSPTISIGTPENLASVEVTAVKTEEPTSAEKIDKLYESFVSKNVTMPEKAVFQNGMTGYQKLVDEGEIKNEILTIIDFGLPSTEKRMWILDMTDQKVLYNTYVAHGQNTGGNLATDFSNTPNSHQSSLGFYVTAETYYGKNGLSLFIDGKEEGFNSNARQRYVVMHGADYATENFIERVGRLGRSYGCPAVPTKLAKEIINTVKGGSALFIYSPSKAYLSQSEYLNGTTV